MTRSLTLHIESGKRYRRKKAMRDSSVLDQMSDISLRVSFSSEMNDPRSYSLHLRENNLVKTRAWFLASVNGK